VGVGADGAERDAGGLPGAGRERGPVIEAELASLVVGLAWGAELASGVGLEFGVEPASDVEPVVAFVAAVVVVAELDEDEDGPGAVEAALEVGPGPGPALDSAGLVLVLWLALPLPQLPVEQRCRPCEDGHAGAQCRRVWMMPVSAELWVLVEHWDPFRTCAGGHGVSFAVRGCRRH
jgi:hypothetical protein